MNHVRMFTSRLWLRSIAEIHCKHSNKECLIITRGNHPYLENTIVIFFLPQVFSSDYLTTLFLHKQGIHLFSFATPLSVLIFFFYLFIVIDSPVSYLNVLHLLWKELLKNRKKNKKLTYILVLKIIAICLIVYNATRHTLIFPASFQNQLFFLRENFHSVHISG